MFLPSLGRGGCEEHALVVSLAGTRFGHEVVMCFPHRTGTQTLVSEARAAGLSTVDWPLGEVGADGRNRYGTVPEQAAQMSAILDAVRPEGVVMMVPWPDTSIGVIGACARIGLPTVPVFCLVRDLVRVPPDLRVLCGRARARNQRWVAVSQDNRRLLCGLYGAAPDEIDVVYNGVDLPEAWQDPDPATVAAARHGLRAELGLPERTRIALTVGRLARPKGYHDLVAAIRQLPLSTMDVHFAWLGGGPEQDALRAELDAAGLRDRVHFLGYRRDVAPVLHAADLFVFPSHAEGCSRALIEAMTSGLPIVASDASSNPELITPGRYGLLFTTGDAAQLAGQIRYALDNPARMRAMAAAAKARARAELTAEAMCRGTYRVLEEVARGRRPVLDDADVLGALGPAAGAVESGVGR
jgi:glycosyltransferase involved in cell wall biosynthesis